MPATPQFPSVMRTTWLSTELTPPGQRASQVRDAAFNLFNLEVSFGGVPPASVMADIHVVRGEQASVIEVNTSGSCVQRTSARSRAAVSDHLLVYFIK